MVGMGVITECKKYALLRGVLTCSCTAAQRGEAVCPQFCTKQNSTTSSERVWFCICFHFLGAGHVCTSGLPPHVVAPLLRHACRSRKCSRVWLPPRTDGLQDLVPVHWLCARRLANWRGVVVVVVVAVASGLGCVDTCGRFGCMCVGVSMTLEFVLNSF
jgi:hypothetical protein